MHKTPTPDRKTEDKATNETKVVTIEHGKHQTVRVLLESDDLVKAPFGGFVSFLREHAVVGVAIGFIIGLQAQTLVKQLVASFITPLLNFIVGTNLQNKQFVVHHGHAAIAFVWGQFVYALADFVVVLFFIYLIVKLFRLDRLDKKKNS